MMDNIMNNLHCNDSILLLSKHNNLMRILRKGTNPQTDYISQLNNLLTQARRMQNARVIFALASLIARRGGVA